MKKVLFTCCADCKTVCIFEFIYSRAVKQKVWSKAEKGERDWRETLFSGLARLGVWDFFSHCHRHCVYPSGASHSTQNRKFRLEIKWNRPCRIGPTGIFDTTFEGGLLWPVWSIRSVGPKFSFLFDKIVVPSTALLNPAYKNNNQTRGGLGRVCSTRMYRSIGHLEFPKF